MKQHTHSTTASCFVAAIVKGLVEHNDITRHFGSLLALRSHCREAADLGLISWDGEKAWEAKITPLGIAAYHEWGLVDLPCSWAFLWPQREYVLKVSKGE